MSAATVAFPNCFPQVRETGTATNPMCVRTDQVPERHAWRSMGRISASSVGKEFATEQEVIPSWSFRLTADGVNSTLRSIESLKEELDEGDGYPARPSEYALTFAMDTVKHAGALLDIDVPAGSACTDVNGGIRVTWRDLPREVRLVIPGLPTGRGYIYIRSGLKSNILDDLSPDVLAVQLMRLR